jgi:hypothetical protein
MAVTARARRVELKGQDSPRIAPPTPLLTEAADYRAFAASVGINLYPWQERAAKYLTAKASTGKWLYREVAVIVARQNGKTKLLVPLIMQRLLAGQKVMHTAQNAKLPREVHEEVATLLQEHFPNDLPKKRAISYAVGHEEIRLIGGGKYRIVAPTKGGARGPSNDLVIVDELREMEDHGFIGAAKPTLTVSKKPQMVYLSNAGTEDSAVLNALKARSETDPVLAYLEWSASPGRAADDIQGWAEANPTLGHDPAILETLETEYRTNMIAGTLAIFETEHLCRWVTTMRERLIDEYAWVLCRVASLGKPVRPVLAVSMDPKGQRAAVAMAWREGDGVALKLLMNVTGNPVDTDALGTEVKALASRIGAKLVGFDPLTDAELVKYLKKTEPIAGQKYANASAQFVNLVSAGRLRWAEAGPITDDLTWTSRKPNGEAGSYHAVRALDDRPIPASLAAIRAVWLASGPTPASPRVM